MSRGAESWVKASLSLLSPCSRIGLLINLEQLTSAVHQGADHSVRYPTEAEKMTLKTYKTLKVEKPGGFAFTLVPGLPVTVISSPS